MTQEAYRLNLLSCIEAAKDAGFNQYAEALTELYKKEFGQ